MFGDAEQVYYTYIYYLVAGRHSLAWPWQILWAFTRNAFFGATGCPYGIPGYTFSRKEDPLTLGSCHARYHQAKPSLARRFLLDTTEIYLPCFLTYSTLNTKHLWPFSLYLSENKGAHRKQGINYTIIEETINKKYKSNHPFRKFDISQSPKITCYPTKLTLLTSITSRIRSLCFDVGNTYVCLFLFYTSINAWKLVV